MADRFTYEGPDPATDRVSIRISADERCALEEAAQEGKFPNLSAYIRRVLRERMQTIGKLDPAT